MKKEILILRSYLKTNLGRLRSVLEIKIESFEILWSCFLKSWIAICFYFCVWLSDKLFH
ncbi:hypothetical protein LSS_19565 [Leptospira santarosai serovar Shermani str. LT 821]|uniref:Uncharacterized protein n=1 Tax=Leptospira santarosai serovar Shermani str. LT 821 TaxID=758847 RepID=K8XTT1_9LEPT|nr:hypothetical protein LSS_19565 [Leptospira santarosai serovar Shermani str. LT 821]EPG82906.1 hypothetical protein LEP1GSC048_3185 [Leptospira santarosai serovar Shermani str. 1342KT]